MIFILADAARIISINKTRYLPLIVKSTGALDPLSMLLRKLESQVRAGTDANERQLCCTEHRHRQVMINLIPEDYAEDQSPDHDLEPVQADPVHVVQNIVEEPV